MSVLRPVALGPKERRAALRQMRDSVLDVVVIGGGVTGCGAALDAALRGLSVGLVEARDYAAGTSSRSSKLIHGGLRYLEQYNFKLVAEALHERGLLLDRIAPHLVHPVPFLFPLRHHAWERAYIGAGVFLYDQMARRGGPGGRLPRHRHLSRKQALRLAPALRDDALVGAIQYWDAQVDDARFTMQLARTAADYGALVANSARVTNFLREGERVVGVRVSDLESGDELEIRARQVVNATGVWTDEVQELVGRGRIKVRASKGIHLLVPRDRIHADNALMLRTEKSVLFVVPWPSISAQGHWIVGTTDTDWSLDKAHPAASRADIDYVLSKVNEVLRQPLTHEDVEGVYAGLRPLLHGESEATSKLSREHAVGQPVPGLVTVAGGKYTTYRVMAADAIDVVARGMDRRVPSTATDVTPLLGATGFQAAWNARQEVARDSGLHVVRVEHMLRRYGTLTTELLRLVKAEPALGEPLSGADGYLGVEARYAASHEGARHLDDILTRRTRISIETWDRGVAAAEPVALLVAGTLGWDDDTVKREVEHYHARVAAERESQEQFDDHTADAARMGAPDVRTTPHPLT